MPTAPHVVVTLSGAAQDPRSWPWSRNSGGVVRYPQEALALAAARDVSFPEDVRLVVVGEGDLPENVFASYMLPTPFRENDLLGWDRFLNRNGDILIRIKASVLASDEAIVAVLAHEAFELNALRSFLPDGEMISPSKLQQLISPEVPGNLHFQAWDDADHRIEQWRTESN
jgi:hypothetical protein